MSSEDREGRAFVIAMELLGLESGEWGERLDERCGDDEALRRAVLEVLEAAPAPSDLERPGGVSLVPEQIGHLRVVRRIGAGGQGTVYEAEDTQLGRRVAAKLLPVDSMRSGQVERFRREAEAAGRLNHPGIVAVHELLEWHDQLVIVQEYVPGGSLEEHIARRGRLPPAEAAELARQIAEALAHAHAHGVVHRDVKPANVLMLGPATIKLGDFGLAQLEGRESLTATGALVGTPYYMSPEQVAGGRGGLDRRCDVYAVGAVLYRMLTGKVPFTGDSGQGLYLDILTRPPRPPHTVVDGIDADLEAVCLKCLAKAPEDRYAKASDLAADLARWLRGESTVARPLGPVGRAGQALKRASVATLVLTIAAIVGATWLLDALVLRPGTEEDVRLHTVRLAVATLAALGLAVPFGHLGRRVAAGRRWATVPGWVLALGLGVGSGLLIREQWLDQLHATDRARLLRSLDLDPQRSVVDPQHVIDPPRSDVSELENYVSRWQGRFSDGEMALVARGFLKRSRPQRAEEWVARLQDLGVHSPLLAALELVVAETRGDELGLTNAESRLWSGRYDSASLREWEEAGHVLREAGRLQDAQRVYGFVAQEGSYRDSMNLRLAQVAMGLCRFDEAKVPLQEYRRYRSDELPGLLADLDLALASSEWSRAEELVQQLDDHPEASPGMRTEKHYQLLVAQGRRQEAIAADVEARREWSDDIAVVELCALHVLAEAKHARGQGDASMAHAQAESSLELYDQLDALRKDHLPALVGKAEAYRLLASLETEPLLKQDQTLAWRRWAQRSVDVDGTCWQARLSLMLALRQEAALAQGLTSSTTVHDEQLPVPVLEACLEQARAALAANGFDTTLLNSVAHWQQKLFARLGGVERLDEAERCARAAAHLAGPGRAGSACSQASRARGLAATLMTLSEIAEARGDLAAALDWTERALASNPGDRREEERKARAEMLRQRLAEGSDELFSSEGAAAGDG